MPESNDEQFEKYLKNFRPVDPEPLPVRTKKHTAGANSRSALAACAVACLAAVALVIIVLSSGRGDAKGGGNDGRRVELTTMALTKLALDDRQAFDEFITDKTQSQFPPMSTEHSALRVLAKQ